LRAARNVLALTVFPLVLGGAVLWAVRAMERGMPPDTATALAIVVSAVLILALERLFPMHEAWLHSRGDLRTDLTHVLSVGVTTGTLRAGLTLALVPAAPWLVDRFGMDLWPMWEAWWIQLPLALVVAELPKYWLHRGMHEWDGLWRFHATHHSVPRLYWLNAARFHPVDIGLDTVVGLAPLILLGCPAEIVALFLLVSAVHGYFQHANLPLRLGPLNYFFSMAQLHRWHHSRRVEEANHNYGQNVIVWDLVFGTFYWPRDRKPSPNVGLGDLPAFPTTWWAQITSPFRWRAIKESR
jgi:sterol desaturase/sphingolipid hydroxylase (fatty acid hydroxylase superfamily)